MWRLLSVAFLVIAIVGCGLLLSEEAGATNFSWGGGPHTKVSESPSLQLSSDDKKCSGRATFIDVKGEPQRHNACVFGELPGTRFARITLPNNQYKYAISFVVDDAYMIIENVCSDMTWCVYGQPDDVLLMQIPQQSGGNGVAYIKNFTNYLKRVGSRYVFEYLGTTPMVTANRTVARTGSIGLSSNGRWALLQLIDYGFVLFDMKTQTYKRISSLDSSATTHGSFLELTVSNDGAWAVVSGYTTDPVIYKLTNSCGDFLEISTVPNTNTLISCESWALNIRASLQGYISAHQPRFSHNSERLVFEIEAESKFLSVTFSATTMEFANPLYVAFGDSFTSGEGELHDSYYINDTNSATNKCHVSLRSYPYILQSAWDIVTLNSACSGSTTEGVRQASSQYISRPNKDWPTLVSLSVGGNDIDFMGKLKTCLGIGTCEWAKQGNRRSTAREIKGFFNKMVDTILGLKADYSTASLFVVGYPDVINATPDASCSAVVSTMLDKDERRYMSESIKYLNKVLQAAATHTKVAFTNIENAYLGERLCDTKELAMNGVRFGDDIAPISIAESWKFIGAESFHPTPRGHQLAALQIQAELNDWGPPPCSSCQSPVPPLDYPGYWLEGVEPSEPPPRQVSQTFLETKQILDVSKVGVNFLANTFSPGTTVRFEIHSDVISLGSLVTNPDGSLNKEITIPGNIKGYHTVHAFGESRSGELIDIYQTVYIDTPKSPVEVSVPLRIDPLPPNTAEQAILASTNEPPTSQLFGSMFSDKEVNRSTNPRSDTEALGNWQVFGLIATAIVGCLAYYLSKERTKPIRPGS